MRKQNIKKNTRRIDKTLFITIVVLVITGLIAVADASAPIATRDFGDQLYFVKQQAVSAFLGLGVLFLFSRINYKFWSKIAVPFFFFNLVLLTVVLIPGIGTKVYGARRWFILGGASFQPSEFAKLALAIYFAKLAEKSKNVSSYFVPLGLIALLVMLQPDLGTTLIIISIGMSQVFVSGASLVHFFAASALAAFLSLILILFSDYRRDRLLTFFQQTNDPLGKAYHIKQVLFALGSGGLWGVGLGQSRQKYLYLPETATDSIFAVIAEEVGFVGSIVLVGAFIFFVFRALRISKYAPDTFSRVLSVGITAWLGGQIMLNIGSMVALVPLTGIPLPFFSYGGSSLIMILAACGILLNISKYSYNKEE